jgi:ribose transport system substrate-binding protein
MKKLKIVVSLTTSDNDYQIEQAAAAEEAARRLSADVQVMFADNDPFKQSQQLLEVAQAAAEKRPDAIVFEPVGGTALPQVARAAVGAGIGWVILNREAEYLKELRRSGNAPVFSISSDHVEIGRIQARQLAALLPGGGTALFIQGPSDNSAAKQRTQGLQEAKPGNIKLVMVKGQWTEESAYRGVSSWLKLSTSQNTPIDAVAAQDDSMAAGARKAIQELADESVRQRWLNAPFLGIDGLPKTGQEYVRKGLLAATVIVPANTTLALELLVRSKTQGVATKESTLTVPISYPRIEDLAARPAQKNRVLVTR